MQKTAANVMFEKGIERGIEKGIERGIEKGIERGRRCGIIEGLSIALEIKFGTAGLHSLAKIEKMDIESLSLVKGFIKDARSLKEFERKLTDLYFDVQKCQIVIFLLHS